MHPFRKRMLVLSTLSVCSVAVSVALVRAIQASCFNYTPRNLQGLTQLSHSFSLLPHTVRVALPSLATVLQAVTWESESPLPYHAAVFTMVTAVAVEGEETAWTGLRGCMARSRSSIINFHSYPFAWNCVTWSLRICTGKPRLGNGIGEHLTLLCYNTKGIPTAFTSLSSYEVHKLNLLVDISDSTCLNYSWSLNNMGFRALTVQAVENPCIS